jgi:hypothetical protein
VSVAALSTEAGGDAAPEVDHARRTLQDHKELASTILQTAAPASAWGGRYFWATPIARTLTPNAIAERPTLPRCHQKGVTSPLGHGMWSAYTRCSDNAGRPPYWYGHSKYSWYFRSRNTIRGPLYHVRLSPMRRGSPHRTQ